MVNSYYTAMFRETEISFVNSVTAIHSRKIFGVSTIVLLQGLLQGFGRHGPAHLWLIQTSEHGQACQKEKQICVSCGEAHRGWSQGDCAARVKKRAASHRAGAIG